ncbi:MAG: hypothetical protein KGH94_04555 [Candidatus Micrarchaeota archaeon]|nr:hypothetical protein [Candidatus Micrarchaeota archaeon]
MRGQRDTTITKWVDDLEAIVKGLPASPGTARGRVVIVKSQKHFGKVKEGDILVAEHTDPSMVLVMQRAAAIVTDMGGITSHAAVVSREMGTPCIVGTKVGTKKLHDGDMVDVDARKGTVTAIG